MDLPRSQLFFFCACGSAIAATAATVPTQRRERLQPAFDMIWWYQGKQKGTLKRTCLWPSPGYLVESLAMQFFFAESAISLSNNRKNRCRVCRTSFLHYTIAVGAHESDVEPWQAQKLDSTVSISYKKVGWRSTCHVFPTCMLIVCLAALRLPHQLSIWGRDKAVWCHVN